MDIVADTSGSDPLLLRFQSVVVVILEIDGRVAVRDLRLARSSIVNGRLRTRSVAPGETGLAIAIIVTERLDGAGAVRVSLGVPSRVVSVNLSLAIWI